MVAQIYVQKYPGEAGGLILVSTGGMDEATLRTLKQKYRLAPLMLWYMKHCNYEKLKPKLISASLRHIRDETPEEIAVSIAGEMIQVRAQRRGPTSHGCPMHS